MRYIDADRLRKEVKRLEKAAHKSALGCADSETRKFHEGKDFAYQHIGFLIDSLQQEQLPGIEDPGIPGKDFIPVDWVDACEKYGKWKIVKMEQPSLPNNLDEAELKYVESLDNPPANQEEERTIYQTFKAGAEWMAKQMNNDKRKDN